MNEELLKIAHEKLGGNSIGSYEEFVKDFNSNEELRKITHEKLGGTSIGTYDEFIKDIGFSQNPVEKKPNTPQDYFGDLFKPKETNSTFQAPAFAESEQIGGGEKLAAAMTATTNIDPSKRISNRKANAEERIKKQSQILYDNNKLLLDENANELTKKESLLKSLNAARELRKDASNSLKDNHGIDLGDADKLTYKLNRLQKQLDQVQREPLSPEQKDLESTSINAEIEAVQKQLKDFGERVSAIPEYGYLVQSSNDLRELNRMSDQYFPELKTARERISSQQAETDKIAKSDKLADDANMFLRYTYGLFNSTVDKFDRSGSALHNMINNAILSGDDKKRASLEILLDDEKMKGFSDSFKPSSGQGSLRETYVKLDNGKRVIFIDGEPAFARDEKGYKSDLTEEETKKATDLYGDNSNVKKSFNGEALANNFIGTVFDMVPTIMLTSVTGGGSLGAMTTIAATTAAQSFGDYYFTALEKGESPGKAALVSIGKAGVDGLLENVGGLEAKLARGGVERSTLNLLREETRAGLLSGKIAKNEIYKYYAKRLGDLGLESAKQGVGEYAEETLQSLNQGLFDLHAYNDNSTLAKIPGDALETFLISFALGAGSTSLQGLTNFKAKTKDDIRYNSILAAIKNPDKLQEVSDLLSTEKYGTSKNSDENYIFIQKMADDVDALNIKEDKDKLRAIQILIEKNNLETSSKKDNAGSVAAKIRNKKIQDLEAELNDLGRNKIFEVKEEDRKPKEEVEEEDTSILDAINERMAEKEAEEKAAESTPQTVESLQEKLNPTVNPMDRFSDFDPDAAGLLPADEETDTSKPNPTENVAVTDVERNVDGELNDNEKTNINNILNEQESNTTERLPQGAGAESIGLLGKATAFIRRASLASNKKLKGWGKTEAATRQREDAALKLFAEKNGGVKKVADFTHDVEPLASGAENRVYKSKDNRYVIKVNTGDLNDTRESLLDRIEKHNKLFPSTAYELIGIVDDAGLSKDKMGFVIRQKFYDGEAATDQEIQQDLEKRGFIRTDIKEDKGGDFTNGNGIYIADVFKKKGEGPNVIKGKEGTLFYIDPIIHDGGSNNISKKSSPSGTPEQKTEVKQENTTDQEQKTPQRTLTKTDTKTLKVGDIIDWNGADMEITKVNSNGSVDAVNAKYTPGNRKVNGIVNSDTEYGGKVSKEYSDKGKEQFQAENNKTPKEQNTNDRVEKVKAALKTLFPDLKIISHKTSKEFDDQVSEESGRKGKSVAMYKEIVKDGKTTREIHLNLEKLNSTSIYHEGTHPVLDLLESVDPGLINRLHDQLVELEKDLGIEGQFTQEFAKRYKSEAKKTEAVVEFIAHVADGKIDLNKKSVLEKIKSFFVELFKGLGINIGTKLKSIDDLKSIASKISEAFREGSTLIVDQNVINGKTETGLRTQFELEADKKQETLDYIKDYFKNKKLTKKDIEDFYNLHKNRFVKSGISTSEIATYLEEGKIPDAITSNDFGTKEQPKASKEKLIIDDILNIDSSDYEKKLIENEALHNNNERLEEDLDGEKNKYIVTTHNLMLASMDQPMAIIYDEAQKKGEDFYDKAFNIFKQLQATRSINAAIFGIRLSELIKTELNKPGLSPARAVQLKSIIKDTTRLLQKGGKEIARVLSLYRRIKTKSDSARVLILQNNNAVKKRIAEMEKELENMNTINQITEDDPYSVKTKESVKSTTNKKRKPIDALAQAKAKLKGKTNVQKATDTFKELMKKRPC